MYIVQELSQLCADLLCSPSLHQEGCDAIPEQLQHEVEVSPSPVSPQLPLPHSALAAVLNYSSVFPQRHGRLGRSLGFRVLMCFRQCNGKKRSGGGSLWVRVTARLCGCWKRVSHPCCWSCSPLALSCRAGWPTHLVLSAPNQSCLREPPLPQWAESQGAWLPKLGICSSVVW